MHLLTYRAAQVLYGDALKGVFGNILIGDANEMLNSHGGDDTLIGAGADNTLIGDANEMLNNSHGGDDTLTGSGFSSRNTLVGDADEMHDNSHGGGDDTLTGALTTATTTSSAQE
jgi:Ca2+-binding RTX toxin-like protein